MLGGGFVGHVTNLPQSSQGLLAKFADTSDDTAILENSKSNGCTKNEKARRPSLKPKLQEAYCNKAYSWHTPLRRGRAGFDTTQTSLLEGASNPSAHATPTREIRNFYSDIVTCGASYPISTSEATFDAASAVENSDCGRRRMRSRTWSGTTIESGRNIPDSCVTSVAGPNISVLAPNEYGPLEGRTERGNRSSNIKQDDPAHSDDAVLRGDVSWSCRRRPQRSGALSVVVSCNFLRLRRNFLWLTYLFLMAICFNAAYKGLPEIDNKKSFHNLRNDGVVRKASDTTRKSQPLTNSASKLLDDRVPAKKATPGTFYAKAGAAPPMYTGGLGARSAMDSPVSTSTSAFFGLVSVIFLTSFVFVRGSEEAYNRWAAVRERIEEHRQMRYGVV